MKRALVIGGESLGYQSIFLGLTRAECTPIQAPDLATALGFLGQEPVDLIALDLGLLPKAGAETETFLEANRNEAHPAPVLGLASATDTDGAALLSEVDDFVLPPYRPGEVAIRVSILLKRFRTANDAEIIRIGPLVIDLARYEATLDGTRLDLTFKEYELLRFLASSPGNVFTRDTLLNKVWGYDYFGGTRTVDVHIRRLRSKVEATNSFIETVRNVGYRFKAP